MNEDRVAEALESLTAKYDQVWTLLVGDLTDRNRSGIVEQISKIVDRLEDLSARIRTVENAIRGDGNGRKGIALRLHDVEGAVARMERYGKYIGAIVTAQFLAIVGYLLRWWASAASGM